MHSSRSRILQSSHRS